MQQYFKIGHRGFQIRTLGTFARQSRWWTIATGSASPNPPNPQAIQAATISGLH